MGTEKIKKKILTYKKEKKIAYLIGSVATIENNIRDWANGLTGE